MHIKRFNIIIPSMILYTKLNNICKVYLCAFLSLNVIKQVSPIMFLHSKCRSRLYPRSSIERFVVPDNKVPWSVEFKEYKPTTYNAPSIQGKPWADPDSDSPEFKPKWNDLDGNVNRKSYTGFYKIVNGVPLNPGGRSGISGRGVLGRWGPNHAADPVVTRWKDSNHSILQFIAIKRRDTGQWALPGGMVDPGEKVAATAIREFQEEALNSLEATPEEKEKWTQKFSNFFSDGIEIYSGYVDDPRNTDNAWMETTAFNFHDENGSTVGALNLNAGDDAVGVQWVDLTPNLELYASHKDIVNAVLKKYST